MRGGKYFHILVESNVTSEFFHYKFIFYYRKNDRV